MTTKAWPFLIGRNKNLGYQTIVSPRFLSGRGIPALLAEVAGGDESDLDEATYREISGPPMGDISLVFRVVRAKARDYDLGEEEFLRDKSGRPIPLIEGFVVQGHQKTIKVTHEDLQIAHEQVKEAFRAFWQENDSFKEWLSLPFDLPAGNDLSSPLRLIYKEPFLLHLPSSPIRSPEEITKGPFLQSSQQLSSRRKWLILSLLLVIVLLSGTLFLAVQAYLGRSAQTNTNCGSGTIAVGGSTALQPLVSAAAQSYQSMCPQATILVNQNVISSQGGLRELEAGNIQIGDSDLQSSNPNLVDHRVAVVIYVLVLNRDAAKVTNLTPSQIQEIYNGSITNWNQVGGPDIPISVVSLTSTSGTRGTFEHYILGSSETLPLGPRHMEVDTTDLVATTVAHTSGAIGYLDLGTAIKQNLQMVSIDKVSASATNVEDDRYTFWTVEHMYTKGQPSGLTQAFLSYVTGNQVAGTMRNDSYLPLNEVPPAIISAHPSLMAPGGL